MSKNHTTDEELAEELGRLPREIRPGRDLWPAISSQLGVTGQQRSSTGVSRQWRNPALAASVVIAFVTGLFFGKQLGISELPFTQTPAPDFAMKAALEAGEREYQAAFRQFVSIGDSRTVLQTQTIENIEGSWVELQQTESALLAALHDYPENMYLNQKLLDLRAHQLDFMKQLATLDQYSRRKT